MIQLQWTPLEQTCLKGSLLETKKITKEKIVGNQLTQAHLKNS